MAEKLFILGRPGSGKSAAFRHIKGYIKEKYGWSAIHYNDYDILRDMFLFEKLFHNNSIPRQFRATKHDGFDVLDFSVLDNALRELEKKVRSRYSKNEKDELIVIEFARDDYIKALRLFSPDFLEDAYFLFLDADLRICIKRVQERVAHPTCEDDHFVSEDILKAYYNKQTIPHSLVRGKIKVITNKGSFQEFIEKLNLFADSILAHELVVENYNKNGLALENFNKTGLKAVLHLPISYARVLTSWSPSIHQKFK